MKKLIFLSLALPILATGISKAQFNYNVTVSKDAYQPLTNGTSLNDTTIWDDEFYKLPLGFNIDIDGITTNRIVIESMIGFATDSAGLANAFMVTDLDLYDRGNAGDSVSRSPVRYELTGTPGNRIMKYEVSNAGIYEEYDLYSTNNDTVNYQVWLYEGSNVIEFRFGPSNISHYSDYYFLTGQPMMGFIKEIFIGTSNFKAFYYFTGSYNSPVTDSAKQGTGFNAGMNIHPPDSTVYRFTPKPVGIGSTIAMLSELQLISNTGNNFISLNSPYNTLLEYKIVSLNGSTLQTGVIHTGINKLDISSLPYGMHILAVSGTGGINMFRIHKY